MIYFVVQKILIVIEQIFEKLEIGRNFSQGKDFFQNFYSNMTFKDEIEDIFEKICSRFSNTFLNKFMFKAFGLQIGHPPARELH